MTPNNFRVKSGLTVGTTISGGNTSITGFANVTGNVQISTINATSFGATITSNTTTAVLTIGNSSVSSTINGTSFSGTSANADLLDGQHGSYYTNATNITTGTLPFAQVPALYLGTTQIQSTSAAQAVTGILTLAAGNTSVSGFINATASVNTASFRVGTAFEANATGVYHIGTINAASHTVGSTFVANTTGAYHTGTINAASFTTTNFIANTTGAYPLSNTAGTALGSTTQRWNLVANTIATSGVITAAANVAMGNNNIINPVFTGYTESEVSNTATTGAWTMDCAAANFFELTLTGSITITPSNVPPSTRMWSGTIVAKQDATGGRTITWPTGIKWPGGSAPPATTTANAIDIWSLMTYDGGTTWVGSLTVKNVA